MITESIAENGFQKMIIEPIVENHCTY